MNDLITNGIEIKQRIITEIKNAKISIKIAMAYFTDKDIAMALVEAKKNNINIDIILSSNMQNETVKLILKGAGINIHSFETGDSRGIMHHKFCLIDNKLSINGSYNYSFNASNNNVENIQVSNDTAVYEQFDSEFERLRNNIENHINSADNARTNEDKNQLNQPNSVINIFSKQINDLIFSSVQIDTNQYIDKGYNDSKNNKGNIDIFKTEYNNIKQDIRRYATDEGLGNTKSKLISNISMVFKNAKTNLENENEKKLIEEERNINLQKEQIKDKIVKLKEIKSILKSGETSTNEKGLLQINKGIEKNKLEKRNLEQSVLIRKFWSLGTVLSLIALSIFIFYLSIFFSSAIYKVFFEPSIIRNSLEAGINPGLPKLIDANAIVKIYIQEGILFGLIGSLFFLIPVLFSNIKILGSRNRYINTIMFLVGILVFDIIVASYVAYTSDEINNLVKGSQSTLNIWEVFKTVEFWLIFLFGMFPLIIVHFIIGYLTRAYKNSKISILNAEKNRKIQLLNMDMVELLSFKESLSNKMDKNKETIDELNDKINNLNSTMNHNKNIIDKIHNEQQTEIKNIFDDYNSRIKSGIIFTEVIFESLISSYKSGFIKFLPEFYASNEVANRAKQIEQITSTKII